MNSRTYWNIWYLQELNMNLIALPIMPTSPIVSCSSVGTTAIHEGHIIDYDLLWLKQYVVMNWLNTTIKYEIWRQKSLCHQLWPKKRTALACDKFFCRGDGGFLSPPFSLIVRTRKRNYSNFRIIILSSTLSPTYRKWDNTKFENL